MGRSLKSVAGTALSLGGLSLGPLGLLAVGVGLALVSSTVAERKAKSALSSSFGTEVQLSGDPNDVRAICYGQAWTGGTLRYRNSIGPNNQDLYLVIVLAGHACDSVPLVKADRETLTLDGSGNVTSPAKWAGLINIRYHLGADDQAADATLDSTFTGWTSDHRLRGATYAIVKLRFDEEKLRAPPAFRFLVKGRKVYDPRLDSTNGGSGSHRLNDATTWAWSNNAILCANDFHRGIMINGIRIAGPGISSGRFHWPNVIAEANVCAENVALDAGGNEDRYTVNGFIDPRQMHDENSEQFEQAFAGDFLFADGKWRYFAGAYRAPSLQLTADHFVGPLRMVVHKSESERRDTAHGRFQSVLDGATPDYRPLSLASATVGAERPTTIDFPLVNDEADSGTDGGARAQRIAKLLLERDAAGKLIHCTTNLYGWRAVPGESIGITHAAFGLTTQTMRVMDVQLRPFQQGDKTGLVVDLTLAAGPESLYAWSAEETVIGAAPTLPQLSVPGTLIARARIYQRAASPPTLPSATVTYTFATGGMTGLNNGWTATIPAGSNPLYISEATALAVGATDTIAAGEWASPVILVQNGADGADGDDGAPGADGDDGAPGADGINSATVYLYRRAATSPTMPSGTFTYTFSTGVLSGGTLNGWTQTVPAHDGNRLWITQATALSATATDSIPAAEFATAQVFANDGAGGGFIADATGKPAGWRAIEGTNSRAQLSLDDDRLRIDSTPDTNVAYGAPAIPVNAGRVYTVRIKHSSSGSSADGLYIRCNETNGALASGKTHIGVAAEGEAVVEERDSFQTLVNDGPMPGTTAVVQEYTYTPTSGAKFMTLGLYNWLPATGSVVYLAHWVEVVERGSSVNLLPVLPQPTDTQNLVPNAATEVYRIDAPGSDIGDPVEDEVSVTITEQSIVHVEGRYSSCSGAGSNIAQLTPYVGGTDGLTIPTEDAVSGNPVAVPIIAQSFDVAPGTYDVGIRADAVGGGNVTVTDRFITITVIKR